MATRTLQKREWRAYFDAMSRALVNKAVEIELLDEELGAQSEAVLSKLMGISYDPKEDALEVALEKLDHTISKPDVIQVEQEQTLLKAIQVTQGAEHREIIKIKEPLYLPAG